MRLGSSFEVNWLYPNLHLFIMHINVGLFLSKKCRVITKKKIDDSYSQFSKGDSNIRLS